jgi:hypothetical protein
MAATVKLEGIFELRAALRSLPADLAHEAEGIVVSHATEAQREIRGGYPIGPQGSPKSNSGHPPGGLRRGVTLDVERSAFGVIARVRSHAHHAHLYEDGTKPRFNKRGAYRGVMPKAQEPNRMIPKVIRIRARMVQALIELVKRAGFQVAA